MHTQQSPASKTRLDAVRRRDRTSDGTFVYGVVSTGIFCKPSCPSRQAKESNIRFFDSPNDAIRAGFRACKRCRPDDISAEDPDLGTEEADLVRTALAIIDDQDQHPSLTALATMLGKSKSAINQAFMATVRLSYADFSKALKARQLRDGLVDGLSATDAVFNAGYGSMSRVYEKTDRLLGMSPGRYANHGSGEKIHYAMAHSDLGPTLIAWTQKGLATVMFDDNVEALEAVLKKRFAKATVEQAPESESTMVQRVLALIAAPAAAHDIPLDVKGTAFQERVWRALTAIPPQSTMTYQQIADAIGQPQAVRAVANACGANRVPVAIPCHRVVRSDGGLGGYAFGVERKKKLLAKEAGQEDRP